jgi:hypothetical protein
MTGVFSPHILGINGFATETQRHREREEKYGDVSLSHHLLCASVAIE